MKTVSWLVSLGLIGSGGQIVNFDSGPLGKTPPGWTVAMTHSGAAPAWEILKDRTAPTLPYVLAQVSDDPTESRFPLALLKGLALRDGDVSVRLKPVTGKGDRSGGLVWRYRDENNYYLVRANAIEGNVTAYRVENGQRIPIAPRGKPANEAAVQHPIPTNAWTILKVSVRGSSFSVYLNHHRILQADDRAFAGPGQVGLWTKGDSVTYFDDFRAFPK